MCVCVKPGTRGAPVCQSLPLRSRQSFFIAKFSLREKGRAEVSEAHLSCQEPAVVLHLCCCIVVVVVVDFFMKMKFGLAVVNSDRGDRSS